MKKILQVIKNGIFDENPTFRLVLGTCPTLAVTTSATNAIGMGAAFTFVLLGSNLFIAALKNFIPNEVRIPAFVVVIASFTTMVQMIMQAFLPALNESLGLYIPLIVVNCIILARAESFASKNGVIPSIFDAIGMGIGFTGAITMIASIREILGNGTLFGMNIMGAAYQPATIMILAPGGFFVFGCTMALVNFIASKKGGKA